MKTKFKIILLLSISFVGYSQNALQKEINANENWKTGNFKDVLASMLQLSTTNFTGDDKSIDFNSTLFAIKTKANPELLKDYKSFNQKFARNFQFNTKVNLDSNYKYKGFTGGITYAIINQRDAYLANFTGSELCGLYDKLTDNLNHQIDSLSSSYSMIDIKNAITKMLNNVPLANYSSNEASVKNAIDIKLNATLFNGLKLKDGTKLNNCSELVVAFKKLRDKYYEDLKSKTLFTVSTNGTTNDIGKFNKGTINLVFLRGVDKSNDEIDLRGSFNYVDTTAVSMPRTTLNFKGGFNKVLGKTKSGLSYFEVKGAFEYNKILRNLLTDEKSEAITANAEFRIRLAGDLWIPITVKYDVDNSNFLGFLNITYNFGG